MSSQRSDLSSVATQLRELTDRITRAGEGLAGGDTEEIAHSLFEAERALRSAQRAVDRAVAQLT